METGYRDSGLKMNERKYERGDEIYSSSENYFPRSYLPTGYFSRSRPPAENIPPSYSSYGYLPHSLHSAGLDNPPKDMEMTPRDRGLPPQSVLYIVGDINGNGNNSFLANGQQQNQIYHDQQQTDNDEEPPKPRKVWWYTVCRVVSAILIILNVTSDWLQYADMEDPIENTKNALGITVNNCTNSQELVSGDVANHFTIAGTVIAFLQVVNIVYQIVQNHRLDPIVAIPDHLDERTEVFLVTTFIEIPQNFLLFRYEKTICLECGVKWDSNIKRFVNGLVAWLSSIWRYITNVKVSSDKKKNGGCCKNPCQKCADCCGNCIKKFCTGLLKCLCPCCCCCFDCKTFFPCCCCSIICKKGSCYTECCCNGDCCKGNSNEPSILANLAALPTTLYTFLYIARVMKPFCSLSGIYQYYKIAPIFINEVIISWFWDKIF
ncbi:uncharacterized protein LOC133205046 [Saccostrea echinata]|uniref:uncharacterized protein LOC133205046 n=1 Tax=Saccostrea echinata TaxID=191078 RepID=UPI002A833B9C|nr:uncharacterized protein LOC133205046 [Saccostrea echinata]